MCQELEIEIDDKIIPQIAGGFAGGIGNTGAVCGAVVGGVMAIGLRMNEATTIEEKFAILAVVKDFRRSFEEEMGNIECRILTGFDLTTEEGVMQFMSSDVGMKVCFPAVGTAFRLVMDLLQEPS